MTLSGRPISRLLPILGLVTQLASACGGSADGAAAPAKPAEPVLLLGALKGPLLWEVPGETGPSYLFGTIHAGYQADKELPGWVWERLSACDTFVMEMDPTSVNPMDIARLSALPEGQSLDAMLGPADWATLVKTVELPESALKRLQPWAVTLLLIQKWFPTPLPLDLALLQRAKAENKQLAFLEDWKFQVDILQMTGVEDLREMLGQQAAGKRMLDDMLEAYRAGDFPRLSALALDPAEIAKNPQRHQRLFDQRNRAWVGQLVPRLRKGRAFVAVGSGHYPGDQGLLRLLEAEGFRPTRKVSP